MHSLIKTVALARKKIKEMERLKRKPVAAI